MKFIPEDDAFCFACGMKNEEGLRIVWKVEGRSTTAEYTPGHKYQGWKGIVHGGILATLLDEAMTRLAWVACKGALTAEMTVRYVKPARVGELLRIRGDVIKESRKLVEMKASLHDAQGELVAHSVGKAIKI